MQYYYCNIILLFLQNCYNFTLNSFCAHQTINILFKLAKFSKARVTESWLLLGSIFFSLTNRVQNIRMLVICYSAVILNFRYVPNTVICNYSRVINCIDKLPQSCRKFRAGKLYSSTIRTKRNYKVGNDCRLRVLQTMERNYTIKQYASVN